MASPIPTIRINSNSRILRNNPKAMLTTDYEDITPAS